jgi:alpha-D-ribose 1-methylphosphonate 5-triphosphate synthase subunit PhnG
MSIKNDSQNNERAAWLSVLAQTSPEVLDEAWRKIGPKPEYEFLRKPEVGMILVRGRAGNTGQPFNFGEMTVTRCAIRTNQGLRGFGYVAGSRSAMAEQIAVLDAMLQDPEQAPDLKENLIGPLSRRLAEEKAQVAQSAGATKVNFFTMPRTRTGK